MKKTGVLKEKLVELIKTDIKDDIVSQLLKKFDEEIVSMEDESDPMRPSLFRNEFEEFLEETIENSIKVEKNSISFGVGDTRRLGLDEELDEQTTDGLRIIGTILNGIVGEYVLVTENMARRMFPGRRNYDLGRTGHAYIMPSDIYKEGMVRSGWPPAEIWKFSNFEGLPSFFDIELDMDEYIEKLKEGLK